MDKKGKYLLSGAASGALNGCFGAGGGLLLVPLLMGWIGLEDKAAYASSVTILWPVCLASAAVYFLTGSLPFLEGAPYFLGGVAGGLLAGRLFKRVKARWLDLAFGVLMIYGGIRAVLLL